MQTSNLLFRKFFAVFLAALLASRAFGQSGLQVYSSGMTNGFEDRSWAPRSLTNTFPVHSGRFSILVTPNGIWQGLYFYHAAFDTTPYTNITFWAHGGTNGGQRLQITALLGTAMPGSSDQYRRFTLGTNNDWEKLSIPLSSLGVDDKTNLTGVCIQLSPTGTSNAFCVADVEFDAKSAPPKPAVAVVPKPATPAAPGAATSKPVTVPATPIPAPENWNPEWWIAGVLIVITGLLAWLVVMLRRSGFGKTEVLPPATSTALVRTDDNENWKLRALAAEAMASKQAEAISGKIIPELTEFAKQSLVQGLYSQRNVLLETQQKAQLELAALEARLAGLQLPLQERIRAYEQRISELEKELSNRSQEVTELASATLVLLRQKLEQEKHREPERSRFN